MARRSKRDIALVIGGFLQQYQRKSQRGQEPNDRGYDREIEAKLKRMKPEEVDEILNGDLGDVIEERS